MAPRIEEALKILPADKVEEVAEFAERLATSYQKHGASRQYPKIVWAAAAKELKKEYPSGVDMAHDALRRRGESL